MKKKYNFKKLSEENKKKIIKNLLNNIGLKVDIKRTGDVNFRMDAVSEFQEKRLIFEFEFGNDVVELPRKLIEDFAVMYNRYEISKSSIILISVLNKLPSIRSDYYNIIEDIHNVLNIQIYTISIDLLELFGSNNIKFQNLNLNDFVINTKKKYLKISETLKTKLKNLEGIVKPLK